MNIKTESGFKCVIQNEALDDWEVLELFRQVDKGDVGAIIDVAPLFLGDNQYEALKSHIKEKYGKVKASIMVKELSEIMNLAHETKNS